MSLQSIGFFIKQTHTHTHTHKLFSLRPTENRREKEHTELVQTMIKLDRTSSYANKIIKLLETNANIHRENLGNPRRNKLWPTKTLCE